MGSKVTIRMPEIRECEECESSYVLKSDDSYIENKSFTDQNFSMQLQNVEFNGCEFRNCDFTNAKMNHLHFVDCRFHHCEFTNSEFSECGFHRTSITNSKLTGTIFERCRLENIIYDDVMGRYVNYSYANMHAVLFRNSALIDGAISETKLKNISFEHVDLSGLEVLNTPLKDIDFTDADINRMRVNMKDMAGMIVDEYQAVMLVSILGVVVK